MFFLKIRWEPYFPHFSACFMELIKAILRFLCSIWMFGFCQPILCFLLQYLGSYIFHLICIFSRLQQNLSYHHLVQALCDLSCRSADCMVSIIQFYFMLSNLFLSKARETLISIVHLCGQMSQSILIPWSPTTLRAPVKLYTAQSFRTLMHNAPRTVGQKHPAKNS